MISLCTVTLDGLEVFVDILLESIANRTTNISEILIAKVDENDINWHEETKLRNDIVVKKFAAPVEVITYGHALGLHACIERASQEYVMLCEPDLFFYSDVSGFYLDLFRKHDLNIIGINHHNATGECNTFFPYPMNLMVKRNTLPNEDWMRGHLKYGRGLHKLTVEQSEIEKSALRDAAGKYLVQGPIPEFQDLFPNKSPDCWFDIGCNLFLWNEERKGKWISFQTLDTHIYTTKFHRNNFKLKEKFPEQKLVYHQTNCVHGKNISYEIILAAYEESKK